MARTKKLELLGDRVYGVLFYRFGREVKKIRYKHLEQACERCFGHVEKNHYQATRAEVVHLETAEVYLTVFVTADGNVFSQYGKGAKAKIRAMRKMIKPRKGEETE